MSREVDDKLGVTYALYGLACVEGINGEAKRAARLWGAASAIGETVGYAESPRERALREPYLAPIRGRIGEAVFEQAQQEGSAMPQDAAIEYALSVPSQDSSAPKTAEHVSAKPPSILSVRELEVLKLVAEGLTDSQVAERLYLSPRTVSQHLRSVYRKLEVPSRAAAVSKANETGLI